MPSIFKYPSKYYEPVSSIGFEHYTEFREAKKEVGRLRDIAHKRVERLKKAGFDKGQTFKRLEMLSKIRLGEIKSKGEAALALSEFYQFLTRQEATVKGARQYKKQKAEDVKKTLSRHGYEVDDLDKFGEFMEKFRAYYGRRIIPSDQAAQLYDTLEGVPFDIDEVMANFRLWTEDMDETERIVKDYKETGGDGLSLSDYFSKELGIRG